MPKTPCKGLNKDGTPCRGNGLPAFDGYCIAHAPADKTREWRSRGGKNSSTAARNDKRIPERLQRAIKTLDQGLLDVRAGTLAPAAFSAMCRGVRTMIDLYRLADDDMELIRNEEAEAAAMEVVGVHGDPAILNAAARIAAQQDQYRIESLVDQGLVTLEPRHAKNADEPPQPVLTDEGKRRLGLQRLTSYTQKDIDQLEDLCTRFYLKQDQPIDMLRRLSQIRADMEKALAGLTHAPPPVRDPLTGQILGELPGGVKTGPPLADNTDDTEQAAKILEDQIQQIKEITREFERLYEEELLEDILARMAKSLP